MMQKTIAVGEFKARCLGLLERVRSKKERLIITKRGKPIAQILPFSADKKKDPREILRGSLLFEKDVVSPLNEPWGEGS